MKRRRTNANDYADSHHLIFTRRAWESSNEGKHLRNTPELIPRLDRDTHNELHATCPAVPLLGYHVLVRTVNRFIPEPGDTMKSIDRLLLAIEESTAHPKTHRIEHDLAQLAIEAIQIQRPLISQEVRYGARAR